MNGLKKAINRKFLLGLAASLLIPVGAYAVDFDNDNDDDLTVYRPSLGAEEGVWYFPIGNTATVRYQWGLNGDVPVAGKYAGGNDENKADMGVWRESNGTWYIREESSDNEYSTASSHQWGLPGDTPTPCDYDGDGLNELSVWRNSDGTWYNRVSSGTAYSTATSVQWGLSGDTPAPADYDGDGKCDYAVARSNAAQDKLTWHIILSSTGGTTSAAIDFGAADDDPIPADFDGDGMADLAVYREDSPFGPLWIIRRSSISQGNLANLVWVFQWGLGDDIPLTGDFDGNGAADIVVFRPMEANGGQGNWYFRNGASFATATSTQFGLNGDIPQGISPGDAD